MTFATLVLFAAAALALAVTPGPDMLLVASRSVSQGRPAAFAALLGVQVGIYGHALLAAFGLSQLLLAVPAAYDAIRYAGAAYLLFLAYKAFRSSGAILAPRSEARSLSFAAAFRQGLLTNLLNPKVALFVLALFPQFVPPHGGGIIWKFLVLATILDVIGFTVNALVIFGAHGLGRLLSRSHRLSRLPNLLLGTVFAGIAVRLAWARP